MIAAADELDSRGWVRVPGAVPPAVVSRVRDAVLERFLAEHPGLEIGRPETYRDELVRWGAYGFVERSGGPPYTDLNTPALLAAMDALVGADRWCREHFDSHGRFFISLPSSDPNPRRAWRPPYLVGRWHVDFGFDACDRFELGSENCALVPVINLTAVHGDGGATLAIPGSHRVITDLLKRTGPLPPKALWTFCEAYVATKRPEIVALEGEAGDAFFLHPYTIHAVSANARSEVRIICNTGVGLRRGSSRRAPTEGERSARFSLAVVRRLWRAKHKLCDGTADVLENRTLDPALRGPRKAAVGAILRAVELLLP